MKLLIVGHIAQATGFARVIRAIAEGLSAWHEVHVLGIDYPEHQLVDPPGRGVILHENPLIHDVFAEKTLEKLVKKIEPQAVLAVNDAWFVLRFHDVLKRIQYGEKLIGYIPFDGKILRPEIIRNLHSLAAIVVYNEFGKSIVRRAAVNCGLDESPIFQKMIAIPHGVETEIFFPLGGALVGTSKRRRLARQQLFPDCPTIWDGFWVLNANRNQPRKRIDLTLKGFTQFATNKPSNVRLYLHMDPSGVAIEVKKLAKNLGIADRLILTSCESGHPEVSSHHLNLIYNACDVGVNTSLGEGWGLTSFEHASSGAPQVVPNHSACSELWKNTATLLPVSRIVQSSHLLEGAEIAPYFLAEALEQLYTDHAHYQQLLEAGYLRVTEPAFRWETICEQWNILLNRIAKRPTKLRI